MRPDDLAPSTFLKIDQKKNGMSQFFIGTNERMARKISRAEGDRMLHDLIHNQHASLRNLQNRKAVQGTSAEVTETLGETMESYRKSKRINDMQDNNEEVTVKKSALPPELFEGYNKLDRSGKIAGIKARDFTLYAVLYYERYLKWPNGGKEKMDFNLQKIYQDALMEYKVAAMDRMSFDELNRNGLLPEYKKLNADGYKEAHKKKFGKYPEY